MGRLRSSLSRYYVSSSIIQTGVFALFFISIVSSYATTLQLVDGIILDCDSIVFDKTGATIVKKGTTVSERVFWSKIAPAQLDDSAKAQQKEFVRQYLAEADSTTDQARAEAIRKGMAPLLNLYQKGEENIDYKPANDQPQEKAKDSMPGKKDMSFIAFVLETIGDIPNDPELAIVVGVFAVFGLGLVGVIFWKISQGDASLTVQNIVAGWPFSLIFFGGAIGGLCGGCAYAISMKIFRNSGLTLLTFFVSIGIGIASIVVYLLVAAVFVSFFKDAPAVS